MFQNDNNDVWLPKCVFFDETVAQLAASRTHYDGIVAFAQIDLTEDLKKSSCPFWSCTATTTKSSPTPTRPPFSAALVQDGALTIYPELPPQNANHPSRKHQHRPTRLAPRSLTYSPDASAEATVYSRRSLSGLPATSPQAQGTTHRRIMRHWASTCPTP